jgi:hypothetical protein
MGADVTGFDTGANFLLNGGVIARESYCLYGGGSLADLGGAVLTTQVMLSVAVPCIAGDTITNISFSSGTTAAGTPTNYWFALYDASLALMAQTADQTSTAWAASTIKTLALAAPVTLKTGGVYYAAVMVKATTTPSLLGRALTVGGAQFLSTQKIKVQTSGAALTATAPATIATPTTTGNQPYVVMS